MVTLPHWCARGVLTYLAVREPTAKFAHAPKLVDVRAPRRPRFRLARPDNLAHEPACALPLGRHLLPSGQRFLKVAKECPPDASHAKVFLPFEAINPGREHGADYLPLQVEHHAVALRMTVRGQLPLRLEDLIVDHGDCVEHGLHEHGDPWIDGNELLEPS
eukprot:4772713-Prymnesium_polylepis.1